MTIGSHGEFLLSFILIFVCIVYAAFVIFVILTLSYALFANAIDRLKQFLFKHYVRSTK